MNEFKLTHILDVRWVSKTITKVNIEFVYSKSLLLNT